MSRPGLFRTFEDDATDSEANNDALENLIIKKFQIEDKINKIQNRKRINFKYRNPGIYPELNKRNFGDINFDKNLNDRDLSFNADDKPVEKSNTLLQNKPKRYVPELYNFGDRKLTRAPEIKSVFPNPIFGESEGEIKRNKVKENYSLFIRNSLKELKKK